MQEELTTHQEAVPPHHAVSPMDDFGNMIHPVAAWLRMRDDTESSQPEEAA